MSCELPTGVPGERARRHSGWSGWRGQAAGNLPERDLMRAHHSREPRPRAVYFRNKQHALRCGGSLVRDRLHGVGVEIAEPQTPLVPARTFSELDAPGENPCRASHGLFPLRPEQGEPRTWLASRVRSATASSGPRPHRFERQWRQVTRTQSQARFGVTRVAVLPLRHARTRREGAFSCSRRFSIAGGFQRSRSALTATAPSPSAAMAAKRIAWSAMPPPFRNMSRRT